MALGGGVFPAQSLNVTVHQCSRCKRQFPHEDQLNGTECWDCVWKSRDLDLTPLEQVCKKYLTGLGVVLWADFDISRPDRLDDASRWLAEQVRSVHGVLGQ